MMMNLFNSDPLANLLPFDGIVQYYGPVMKQREGDLYLERLLNTLEWKPDTAMVFGKLVTTSRKVAWYGDRPFAYTYSGTTKKALPWTEELLTLKHIAEECSGETYNSCLANLYRSGEEGMAWHSDAEKMLRKSGAIASMSFGAERKFVFKHKQTEQVVSLILQHGSLLIMKGTTQTHWLHRLPPTAKVKSARVNLTFRTIAEAV
ncbi:MAG: alpha-ketoglutarate-dependent dioxygenase AlkB family protein [Chitinophagaceae bacterium]